MRKLFLVNLLTIKPFLYPLCAFLLAYTRVALLTWELFQLTNMWGHLSITGHGSGQAIIQLDYSYGVDYEPELDVPPVPAFDFNVRARYYGRNNSHLIMEACSK